MDVDQFEEVFDRLVNRSRLKLIDKAKEYADDSDRLVNFKKGAAFQGETPEETLWGYATKHFVSISDLVRIPDEHDEELWDEKIGDAFNYLILLRALVEERQQRMSVTNVESDVRYEGDVKGSDLDDSVGVYRDVRDALRGDTHIVQNFESPLFDPELIARFISSLLGPRTTPKPDPTEGD